ncbi:MAG TPA: hypothetical protein VMY38_07155 [Gemmatimonadaceae bacterium]|nr:hypothetical protein [Gemmatimonadaceae bacterium]
MHRARYVFTRLVAAWTLAVPAASLSAQTPGSNADTGYAGPVRRAAARPITIGRRVESTVTPADPTLADGTRFQVWRFSAQAGQDVAVALDSPEFDVFLMLLAADGESQQALQMKMPDNVSKIAQTAIRVPRDGDYLIVANTQRPDAVGRYRLSLRTLAEACAAGGPCTVEGDEDSGLTPIRRINAGSARRIALGDSSTADLAATDGRLMDSSYFDAWRYQGRAGERIVIDLVSSDFDPYLIFTRPTAEGPESMRENDDTPPMPDSRLAVELPDSGTYVIVTTSFQPGRTGRYALRIRPLAEACAAGGPCDLTPAAPERRSLFAAVRAAPTSTLSLGDSISDRLSHSDPTLSDDTYFQAYRFTGAADADVAIFLSARAPSAGSFDTYLHLLRPDGDTLISVDSDDDGGSGKNSLITARLPVTGEYVIVANGLSASDTGNFSLSLLRLADACSRHQVCEIGDEPAELSASQAIMAITPRPIFSGTPVASSLAPRGPRLPDDKPFEVWRYTARRGERIVVTNRSSDFDAYLYVYRLAGNNIREVARDDDGAESLGAQIALEIPEAGEYLIVPTSFSTTAQGDYRLTIEPMAAACAAGGPCAPGETSAATGRLRPAVTAAHRPLTLPDTISAVLPDSAPQLPGSGRFQAYRFRGRANDRIALTMESAAFDPHLHLALLAAPSVRLVGSDDDGGTGINARLVATLPEDGEYLVVASALSATGSSTSGPYTLAMAPCDSACAAFSDAPATRTAASYASAVRAPRLQIASGASVEGTLAPGDSTLNDGAHFHAYWIQASEGQPLRAAMQSSAMDPYLTLLRLEGDSLASVATDDDGGEGLNALLDWTVDRNGTYVLVATAASSRSLGAYTLLLDQSAATTSEQFLAAAYTAGALPVLRQALAQPHQTLRIGQTQTTEMPRSAPTLEGSGRFQSYRFRGEAGQRVVITLRSDAFDPYLRLAHVDGRPATLLANDDDSGDGMNARIVDTLPAPGEYLVIASVFAMRDSTLAPTYSISVDQCDDACAAYRDTPGSRSVGAYQSALRSQRRAVSPAGTAAGTLAGSDAALGDGTPFHGYWIEAVAGQTLRAALAAGGFDPYLALLRLEGDSLVLITADDDGGEGLSALIEFPVDRRGTYVLVATGVVSSSTGSYVLHVEQGNESAAEAFRARAANAATREQFGPALAGPHRPLVPGDTVSGEIRADAPRMERRGRFHTYRFEGRANDRFVIHLESDNFDPYLFLVRAAGEDVRVLATDDDGGEGSSSRLVATLPADGAYIVVATTYGASDSSSALAYRLRLERCDDACAQSATEAPTSGRSVAERQVVNAPRINLSLGQPVQARLASGDRTLLDGSYFHAYAFDARAGAILRASMEATAFDPILVLYRVDGNELVRVTSDDDGGEGMNSLITWTVDTTASYVLVANSIARGATGAYTLSASIGNAAP